MVVVDVVVRKGKAVQVSRCRESPVRRVEACWHVRVAKPSMFRIPILYVHNMLYLSLGRYE